MALSEKFNMSAGMVQLSKQSQSKVRNLIIRINTQNKILMQIQKHNWWQCMFMNSSIHASTDYLYSRLNAWFYFQSNAIVLIILLLLFIYVIIALSISRSITRWIVVEVYYDGRFTKIIIIRIVQFLFDI